jgi:Fur family iron response transcriptional regulator
MGRRQNFDEATSGFPQGKHCCGNACARGGSAARRASAWRLAELLFAKGDRHLTAEMLHEEATGRLPVSLATVYNTLHQFTEAGLLRILAVEGTKTYFDTNTSDHHHFYHRGREHASSTSMSRARFVSNLPNPPEGMEIANVDIVVRLRPQAPGLTGGAAAAFSIALSRVRRSPGDSRASTISSRCFRPGRRPRPATGLSQPLCRKRHLAPCAVALLDRADHPRLDDGDSARAVRRGSAPAG